MYTPNYETLRDEAIAAYHLEKKKVWKDFFICLFLNIFLPLCLNLIMFSISMYSFKVLWLWFAVCVFIFWFPFWLRALKKPKENYLFRLRKAVHEMEKIDVYMQIPDEDLHRFDKFRS